MFDGGYDEGAVSRLRWLKLMTVLICFSVVHLLLFVWQGVIPKYGDMLDEMTTGTCVALEVRKKTTWQLVYMFFIPFTSHLRQQDESRR